MIFNKIEIDRKKRQKSRKIEGDIVFMKPMTESYITITSLKYDKSKQYEWFANVIKKTDEYIVTIAPPGRQLFHYAKNKIFNFDNWSIEIFPFNKWYTASIGVTNGLIDDYYCNICMPSTIDGDNLCFIDLDLDYVNSNGEWKMVDQDEFEINQVKYNYPEDLIERTKEEMGNLINLVNNREFPFDGIFQDYIKLTV